MPSNPTRLYQAVLRDKAAPISLRLRRTLGQWLVGKGLPFPDAGKPLQAFDVDGTRVRVERRGDCGRYVVEESLEGALLRTRVTYHEPIPGLAGWVVVTVEEDGAGGDGHAPGFVPAYLRSERISDGTVHLTDAPDVLDEYDVGRLIDTLCQRERRVPVVVMSVDPQDPAAVTARADYLAAATAGAGVVVRFADGGAQRRFNEALGPDLEVFGGGLRTYVAPFDPKTESYPFRHLPMGGGTLRSQGDRALNVVAGGVIGQTARRTLPDDVQRAYRIVSRILAGKAEPSDIHDAVAPRLIVNQDQKEELRRRLMALTVRPAPVAAPGPAPVHSLATVDAVAPVSSPAGVDSPASADETVGPEPEQSRAQQPVDRRPEPVFDVGALAQTVAAAVVKELHGELEAALDLAAQAGGNGSESGHLLRQMRTLGAHVDGLREVVLDRQRSEELHAQAAGEALLAEAEGESDRLAAEMERLRAEQEILQNEYAEAVANTRKLGKRVRWLEKRLAESGQPAYGVSAEEPDFEPTSLMDGLNMARETLGHVVIGDTDTAATKLDLAYPTLSRVWAAKTWDALRALDAFAKARSSGEFAGGFLQWCMSAADLTIPAGTVAMSESKTVNTNGKYSTSRTFAVPEEVHPSGRVLMEAHIKLRKGGVPAPRIHFHDDSGGATGKIWVGHVGDHLPNTLTN
ncbi:hypothetical protein DQ384_04350 [Sphaerisporangium album]|uniref:Uncharacterized protein n=2 Tax=Sphaerisporangium album TaxID=509200 RepID=A0A367FQP4_9ACTN|nr:hypothetical protein DQ384_04350 [Sphaerisporangium album]